MFELDGEQYSLEQVTAAAEQSNMSLEEYLKEYNIKKLEETVETVGKAGDVVVEDATVTSSPEQASESTELEQVDISSGLEDPKPTKVGRAQVRAKELESRDKAMKLEELEFDDFDASKELKTSGSLFKANLKRASANLAEFPAFVNRIKFAIGKSLATDEDKQKISNLTPKQQDELAQVFGGASVPGALNIGVFAKKGQESAAKLRLEAEKLEENLIKYDSDIYDTIFKEGDVTEGVTRLVTQGIGTIPSIMQAMIPYVGISSIIAGSAAEASREVVYEKGKDIDLKQQLYSTGIGMSEGLLEIVTKKIGKSAFKGLIGKPKEVVKKTLLQTGTGIVKAGGSEGLSETGTLAINKFLESKYFNEKGLFDMDEQKWNEFWDEAGDTFLIGMATGKGMAGTGATAKAVRDAIGGKSIKKTLNKTDVNDVSDAFTSDAVSNSAVELARNNFSDRALDIELNTKVKLGSLTKEYAEEIKTNFNDTKSAVTLADNLNIGENLINETVGLIKERAKVAKKIKQAGDNKALVSTDVKRLSEIDNRLSEISSENQLNITTKAVKDIVSGVEGLTIEIAENQEQADEIAKNKNLNKKASVQQGFILQDPKTGEQTIVINKEIAKKEQAVNVSAHELLHGILFKTVKDSPSTAENLGSSLLNEINNIDYTKVEDSKFKERLELYSSDPESIKMEEAITLFSDAIATGDINFNENVFTKIGDQIRRVMQSLGVNIKFNTGRDVYNFVKDYNKSIEKGKLTRGQVRAAKEGIKGALIKEAVKDTEVTIKESKANKELGAEIKALVPEGTTKRRYDSRVIGDVYAKLVQGNTLDGLINGQLNKFGVVGDNVYGKPKDVFLEDVKAQLYEKSLTRFNPETNDDLGGFVVNELIRYRIGDVVNRYKKEAGVSGKSLDVAAGEAGSVQEVADDAISIEEQIDVADTVSKEDSKLTKATKILSKEQYNEASEIIKEKIKDIDPKNLSYKKVGGFITDILSYITSVPADKILDATKNLSQGQVTTAAMFIEKNIDYIRRTLPEGAVLGAATEKLMGTSTGVPSSVLKRLYDKNPRIKKGAGLSPWTLKKGLTNNDILEAIGRPKGVEPKRISPRSPEGQVIKGILNIVDKNITNELVRTVESDLTLEQKQDVAAGKSRLMFSKAIEESTDKEFLDKEISSKQKVSISNSVKDVLVGKNTKDALMVELNDSILRKVEDSKNMRQVLEAMFSEPEKLLSPRQARELQAKLITAVQDGFSQDQSARSLVYSAAKSIKTFFKYQREIIGYGYVKNKLKQDLKSAKTVEQKVQLVKEFLVFGSRSIRTSKIDDITTNKAIFDKIIKPLIKSDSDLKDFKTFTRKGRSYITYKGNIIKGLSSIYDIKNNFAENIDLVDLEADISREYIIKQIEEARKNNDIDGVIAMLALLTSDQRGALRKSSKAGFYVDDASVKDYILEHEMEAYEIHKAYVNYAKDGDINKLNNILNNSYVNSIPKYLDDILNAKGVKERNIDRYKRPEFIKELQKLYDKGLLKNIDRSKYGIKFSKAENLDKTFNDILENKSGIPSMKRYGVVEAITKGSNKGKFNFFIPPSAEDFVGLLYFTLGKGKVGDAQMSWYKKNLIDPYAEGVNKISKARVYMMNTYNSLKKQLDVVPKDLAKKIEGTDYTREQALRVYIWNKQKMNIPGISDADVSKLTSYIADDANLQSFGDQLINMQMGDGYVKPKEGWPAGTITTDILEGLNTTKRAKYLKNWQDNVDAIFSEENLNKLQAIYGLNYRKALKNMLSRMKSGRNRSFSGDSLTGRFTDWLTGSVGTIMFLNTRSAVLQTISAINFVNFTDNNVLAAGKAFANQKQYWADFMTLMNSDFLKERRGGLRINVNEADIADMAKKGGVKGAISKLLELGFAPTQIADSFAIASGGSAFYRNRINTYLKEKDANGNNVYTKKQAEKKAFEDFRETAEESQQSSRPDRISQQQASPLGRVILAFANTPAQYARIIKKAASDLKNGRGDAKENISKIIYYGAAQNLIFNALQQALFAFGFGEDEPEEEEKQKKYVNIANGMLDSLLRGGGIGGSIIAVGKNAVIKIIKELEKDRPKLQNMVLEVSKISPPVSAKLSRLQQAARSYDWNKQEMKEKGLSLDNPAFLAGANVVSALTNIPLDRAIKKANNVVSATSQDLETWERLALLGGWSSWELGIKDEKKKEKKKPKSKIPVSKVKVRR